MLFSIVSHVALAAAVTASPVGSSVPRKTASSSVETDPAEIRSHLHLGTAHGGALDLPKPTAPPSMNNMLVNTSPDWRTISVYNRQPGSAITTVHVDGEKSPKPWGGQIPSGNIGEYGSSVFYIPKDYEGNFSFNKAGFSVSTGDESQIEFSYKDQYLDGNYYFDINVSYVNGFSLPAFCVCGSFGSETHSTGCAKDLWSMNSCPNNNGQGSCRNPSAPC